VSRRCIPLDRSPQTEAIPTINLPRKVAFESTAGWAYLTFRKFFLNLDCKSRCGAGSGRTRFTKGRRTRPGTGTPSFLFLGEKIFGEDARKRIGRRPSGSDSR
jgi:hypothetical protein